MPATENYTTHESWIKLPESTGRCCTHRHKRQGLIHRSMTARPLHPLLLTHTTQLKIHEKFLSPVAMQKVRDFSAMILLMLQSAVISQMLQNEEYHPSSPWLTTHWTQFLGSPVAVGGSHARDCQHYKKWPAYQLLCKKHFVIM